MEADSSARASQAPPSVILDGDSDGRPASPAPVSIGSDATTEDYPGPAMARLQRELHREVAARVSVSSSCEGATRFNDPFVLSGTATLAPTGIFLT